MKAVVRLRDIIANPYQARKKMDRTRVRALADEIREAGLWPGSLRGRMKGEKVELCMVIGVWQQFVCWGGQKLM